MRPRHSISARIGQPQPRPKKQSPGAGRKDQTARQHTSSHGKSVTLNLTESRPLAGPTRKEPSCQSKKDKSLSKHSQRQAALDELVHRVTRHGPAPPAGYLQVQHSSRDASARPRSKDYNFSKQLPSKGKSSKSENLCKNKSTKKKTRAEVRQAKAARPPAEPLNLPAAEAKRKFSAYLTKYEKKEITGFKNVYFIGLNKKAKRKGAENEGFDDEQGYYQFVKN